MIFYLLVLNFDLTTGIHSVVCIHIAISYIVFMQQFVSYQYGFKKILGLALCVGSRESCIITILQT